MPGEQSPREALPDKVTEAAEAAPADDPRKGAAGEAEIARLDDQLRRTAADLDNLRKRYQRDLDRERSAERARAAIAWLPVVDNLELALQHADAGAEVVVEGIKAVHQQAVAALERLGYPRFDPAGEPFDPAVDEAVSTLADPTAEPGTVIAVVRPGYGTPDALLRPASVVVAKQ
ncbi:nucleotide exchange factor GrpE [Kribbella sp.]|uniref:nucleotide exchange factor GrpE n=1 Tax=Kribbella sp. TaxID=1871183 RepID=UPI002D6D38FD|nr:nucleotide exchange factor GrpE [Kribbella sp.]HZX04303.1 nucleotide exchange factor GrpE [Kribbella sp.]